MVFDPTGNYLALAPLSPDRPVILWDLYNKKKVAEIKLCSKIGKLAWIKGPRENSYLVTGSADSGIRVWEVEPNPFALKALWFGAPEKLELTGVNINGAKGLTENDQSLFCTYNKTSQNFSQIFSPFSSLNLGNFQSTNQPLTSVGLTTNSDFACALDFDFENQGNSKCMMIGNNANNKKPQESSTTSHLTNSTATMFYSSPNTAPSSSSLSSFYSPVVPIVTSSSLSSFSTTAFSSSSSSSISTGQIKDLVIHSSILTEPRRIPQNQSSPATNANIERKYEKASGAVKQTGQETERSSRSRATLQRKLFDLI
jgi:hypothetical protein